MNRDRTIANQLCQTELMLAGLANHAERLAGRGLNADFLAAYSNAYQKCQDSFNVQQALKARLMEKRTERLNYQIQMGTLYRQARKLVKIDLPKEAWREFGIEDQR